jgi:hypothetical protein
VAAVQRRRVTPSTSKTTFLSINRRMRTRWTVGLHLVSRNISLVYCEFIVGAFHWAYRRLKSHTEHRLDSPSGA